MTHVNCRLTEKKLGSAPEPYVTLSNRVFAAFTFTNSVAWRCAVQATCSYILVYSVDSRESFDEVRRLLAEICELRARTRSLGHLRPAPTGGLTAPPDCHTDGEGADCPFLRTPPPLSAVRVSDIRSLRPRCFSSTNPTLIERMLCLVAPGLLDDAR